MSNKLPLEECPVSVYNPENQKLLFVFNNYKTACQLLFNNKYSVWTVRFWVNSKKRNDKNIFKKELAYRKANTDQIESLGDNRFLCLDKSYNLTYREKKMDLSLIKLYK